MVSLESGRIEDATGGSREDSDYLVWHEEEEAIVVDIQVFPFPCFQGHKSQGQRSSGYSNFSPSGL